MRTAWPTTVNGSALKSLNIFCLAFRHHPFYLKTTYSILSHAVIIKRLCLDVVGFEFFMQLRLCGLMNQLNSLPNTAHQKNRRALENYPACSQIQVILKTVGILASRSRGRFWRGEEEVRKDEDRGAQHDA